MVWLVALFSPINMGVIFTRISENFQAQKQLMLETPNFSTFNIFLFEKFLENFAIYHSWDIYHLRKQHLRLPLISIQNLLKVSYSQLFIDKWNKNEFFSSYLSLQEETQTSTIIHNGEPKSKKIFFTFGAP